MSEVLTLRNGLKLGEVPIAYWQQHVAAFIETCLVNPETGQPYKLYSAEKLFLAHMFRLDAGGRLLHTDLIYSCGKKGGKTEFGAIVLLVMITLFGGRYAEGYACANDQEQARSRVFERCCRIIGASPLLRHEARILADRIEFPATGSVIIALASDYASAAGGHPTLAVFDELWGYTHERARRLWDELVPVPSRKISARLVVSHAGFENESELLFDLYRHGLAQPQSAPDLYAGDGQLMFWTHQPISPLQDDRWRADMKRKLRPMQYRRMIENHFTTAEDAFIDMAWLRACTDPNAAPLVADKNLPVWAGVDASTKHDQTALACIAWDRQTGKPRLATHRIFQPSAAQPLDFEQTIERTILEWRQRFALRGVWYDPHQMAAVAQRLQRAGVRMVEYPQTVANLTAIGSNLYELIKGGNLLLYPDEQIRRSLSQAVGKETARGGFQIIKEKQAHRIDIVAAMAMAAYACVLRGHVEPVKIVQPGIFSNGRWWDDAQANTPAPAGYRPTNEPWRSFVTGPDIGLRTFGPPPGSGPREW